jgi:hypothetical protein
MCAELLNVYTAPQDPAGNSTTILQSISRIVTSLWQRTPDPDEKKNSCNQIAAAKIRFLRLIARYRRTHRRRNEDISQELNIFDVRKRNENKITMNAS